MAFLIKRALRQSSSSASQQGAATLDQWVQVTTPTRVLPATTTDQIFRVRGGRVLVRALIGEVTVATDATATNLKVSSKKLSNASAAVGTAVDIAANVAAASQEVGASVFVEGDGTAAVLSTAGAILMGTNTGAWVAPQGEIYLTTSATNAGSLKWDIFYQPLDAGAYVDSVTVATVAI